MAAQFMSVRPDIKHAAGFSLLKAEDTGVTFTNLLAQSRHLTNSILLNGSGVACGDVDGDGRVDIYFCGLDGPNVLYRNLGNWKFQDITAESGVACAGIDATAAALADLDGDRDLDLIVNSIGGGTLIFFNDGKGHFRPSAQNSLNRRAGGMSLALADIDGNGSLDLYIANYRTVTIRDQPNTKFSIRLVDGLPQLVAVGGRPVTDPDLTNRFSLRIDAAKGTATAEENGEPDVLLLNDGHGNFTPMSFTGGRFLDESGKPLVYPPFDWGLSVMMRDLNGDGAPDIYVCNDFKSPDRIWINDGRGNFRAIAPTAIRQTPLFSMGLDVADVNRDGVFDIFVVDMLSHEHRRRLTQKADMGPDPIAIGDLTARAQSARNTLLLGRGDGTFAEVAQAAGVEASEWSWTPIFLDVDLDGYEDLLIANGFERDGMSADVADELKAEKLARKLTPEEQLRLRVRYPRLATPNLAFRNLGNGRFAEMGRAWNFDQPGVSQGMALADLDGDGDLDVVINNLNGPAFLLRNDSDGPRVAVRLRGNPPNTRGIGAKITVFGGPVTQMEEMICGGRYLSSDDAMRAFAAGSASNQLRIEVQWRNGKRSVVENVPANSICEIDEASATVFATKQVALATPLFEDISARLNHRHVEEPFDDFQRQPLLPHKLSQAGPGVSWFDFDGDGRDDLIVPSGRGGTLAFFRNSGRGEFIRITNAVLNRVAVRDQTTALGWRDAQTNSLLIGEANYEDGGSGGAAVQEIRADQIGEVLPAQAASVGTLALGDVDDDGVLEMFVGGHAIAARFPEGVSSFIARRTNDKFVIDEALSAALTNVGLVNSAVFTDITGDGGMDLVLACEWGPLRVFENRKGRLVEVTDTLGFKGFSGLWNGVAAGDFDGDGRMDIVAANWGKNTKYEFARAKPVRLYYGDFDDNGVTEVIEAIFDSASQQYASLRQLDVIERGMPWVHQRFSTWSAFSRASVHDVLGLAAASARFVEAAWFSTTVFLNRGDHFEPVRLPDEAQLAPAFGVCVADFDGDGNEDIFLAQNFFDLTSDASRCDAGRGLLLRGNGRGGFKSLTASESGIAIYGEQRGAAVCDFDGDGRLDLAVGQNGAETKLFHNLRANPGLRVRLEGSAQNPTGVGAMLRIGDGEWWSAAREIHAGSGYWSQDSAAQVLARNGDRVRVRWPGGKTTVSAVPAGANEIAIDTNGRVKVLR